MSAPNRRLFLGGSDAPKVLGVSDWGTPLDLWSEKTGRKVVEIDEARQKRFARGHKLEPFIREMTIEKLRELGHDVKLVGKNRRHTDPSLRFLRAEIDFELELDGVLTNVDAKSVGGTARAKWGTEGTDEIPIDYLAQFMHGLGVTGRQTCIAAALRSFDDVELFYVQRDEETIEAMRSKMSTFWREHVKKEVPPDPITFADVRELFPKSTPRGVEASGEVIKHNVQNGHSAPLRDDLDALTAAIKVIGAAVDRIQETAAGTASDIRGIRRDVGRNADATIATGKMLSEHERRLDAAAERLGEVEQLQSVLMQRQRDQY